ncbi:YecA family protein [Agitococcus lubricus]|uniref:YecA family protein n=1 Tax=Agitococcus lubricus TaxID=1077255 RepID=A0A2T5IX50_9GAMM|nr:YecA family protein [Agitococcus lubricus]PTQ88523.1 uncharacterized protein C8N29_11144 [Agitococcus lubricus]
MEMHERYALSEQTLNQLEDYLDSEDNEHGLNFCGTHGFLCAITVGPTVAQHTWLDVLFEGEVATDIVPDLLAWQKSIHALLYHEETVRPPCELMVEQEENDLTDWCIGFMEGMLSNEEAWYAQHEDTIIELTLPIVTISGLVEDDELNKIRRNRKLLQQLAREIPEVLTELYLFFHAPQTPH